MKLFARKKLKSGFAALLSFAVVVSALVCQCPPSEATEHSHHEQATHENCHGEQAEHQHNDEHSETSGSACLCSHDTLQAFVTSDIKMFVPSNFFVAILDQAQLILNTGQQALRPLPSTHSPPRNTALYITHSSLLI